MLALRSGSTASNEA